MVKYKELIFIALIILFLLFSFSPTIFELSKSNKLVDRNREFILEHNYYWPDFNLYLSKVRQGWELRLTALERYTSERHAGSLIQEFYVILGAFGRFLGVDPNFSYQLGRIIFSPLLLLIILLFVKYYFKTFSWQIIAFLIVVTSGSFPKFYTDSLGAVHVARFMEWWSNIDALQRITFIPHILFGQVVSFYLLYQLIIRHSGLSRIRFWSLPDLIGDPQNDRSVISTKKLILLIFLGNLVGLVFPPSLITLNGVLLFLVGIKFLKMVGFVQQSKIFAGRIWEITVLNTKHTIEKRNIENFYKTRQVGKQLSCEQENFYLQAKPKLFFIIFTLPSLLYIFLITKQLPWSALIEFHRTHPMMIPLDQYVLGTGPIIFLGFFGMIVSIIKRDKRFQPLIFWVLVTFLFASFFSVVKEQSPLRFTQTGLFIPLGLLGAYFFHQLFHLSDLGYLSDLSKKTIKTVVLFSIIFYLLLNLFMMKTSLDWQTTWITQRVGASIPAVPYPPQTMYPLKGWMDGIRWLRDNTDRDDVILAEITAGNYIPAYSGNTVYFGQANTVDYERKQLEVDKFLQGKMGEVEVENFLKVGRIKYVFFSVQEKEKAKGKNLESYYPSLKVAYSNDLVTIYSYLSP